MNYPRGMKEYALIKLETVQNKTAIARELKRAFELEQNLEAIRKWVSKLSEKAGVSVSREPVKRLFFDIETSFYIGWFWQPHWKTSIGTHQILQDKKIIVFVTNGSMKIKCTL